MKQFYIFLLIIFYMPLYATTMLIINTGYYDPYYFSTMSRILKDFKVDTMVIPWYQLKPEDYRLSSMIYMELNDQIIWALTTQDKHILYQKMRETLLPIFDEIKLTKKTVIFGISPVSNAKNILNSLDAIKKILGLITNYLPQNLNMLLNHLFKPSSQKSYAYDTALLTAQKNPAIQKFPTALRDISLLPSNRSMLSLVLQPLYPLGGYFVPKNGPLIILMGTDYIHAFDMQENFTLYPMHYSLQQSFIQTLMLTLLEISLLPHKALKSISVKNIPEFIPLYALGQKKIAQKKLVRCIHSSHDWLSIQPFSIAWMHLQAFKRYRKIEDQDAIALRILKSRVNMLWLELMPELYLSDRAGDSKTQKEEKIALIDMFTQALKRAQQKSKLPLPKLLVGLELTGNFLNKPPEITARDIAGNNYPHIPSPLDDKNFWQKEVVDVVNRFYTLWQKIGNGLPLSGVFLDLEMYHAPLETAQFLNMMDFSDIAWNIFVLDQKQRSLIKITDHQKRLAYLLSNNLFVQYFLSLQKKAQEIGSMIAREIRATIPQAIIGIYNPTLPYNWFYLGFAQGISSCRYPILLATFNLNAYRHYPWLTQQNIYSLHAAPILLSKLRSKNDFSLIPYLQTLHDGIWFNRFSQLEEPIKDYTNVEVSPLDTNYLIEQLPKYLK